MRNKPGGNPAPNGRATRKRPGPKRRGGRPEGSVTLTGEIEDLIVSYTVAGAFAYVAAEAAGVDDRTFRDWMARGEGRHSTRKKTAQLAAFARRVRQAQARARAAREIEVARTDPKYWLTHAARTRPGREGWTEPVEERGAAAAEPDHSLSSPEDAAKTLNILIKAGAFPLPKCPDPACPCISHGGNHV